MALLARAWITFGRAQRRLNKRRVGHGEDGRGRWIREHAPGRSFADIGGLFALAGDTAFLAEEVGAAPVTLFDAGDPDLCPFAVKREERGSSVRFVQGDLEDPVSVAEIGTHDIVWCSGVIYHTPNPVRQLLHLREITGELLYLGTHTIPEIPGIENACIYYPGLPGAQRSAYASAHRQPERLLGIGVPCDDSPMRGHGNFWWGITPSALRAMLATARFEVVEEHHRWEWPFLTDVVARPVDRPPLLPPVPYYRERGRLRERDGTRLPFNDYYETEAGGS